MRVAQPHFVLPLDTEKEQFTALIVSILQSVTNPPQPTASDGVAIFSERHTRPPMLKRVFNWIRYTRLVCFFFPMRLGESVAIWTGPKNLPPRDR